MKEAHKRHLRVLAALRDGNFDSIAIKKQDRIHYLIVSVNGKPEVYADHAGIHKKYRHAWQIRAWLKERFGISTDSVPVDHIS